MKNRIFIISLVILAGLISRGIAQEDFSLEDLNPNSETYGEMVGPSDYLGDVCVVFFGHEY
jgi:hypothetical protein